MRNTFDSEMRAIHHRIVRMAVSVENSVRQAMKAIRTSDVILAEEIVSGDDFYDDLQKEVETLCIHTILRRQPVAIDLRKLFAVIKIVTDLERIADHCADLAELVGQNPENSKLLFHPRMEKMAIQVIAMLQLVIEGYIDGDVSKCKNVIRADGGVDSDFAHLKAELASLGSAHPEAVPTYFSALIAAKYLERMADHTTNIAEWILWASEQRE